MKFVNLNPVQPKTFNPFSDRVFNEKVCGDTFLKEILDQTFTNSLPSVNISESKEFFMVDLAAPGLEKDDFIINLEKHLLTISAQKENSEGGEELKFSRKEFSFNKFERSFRLPNTIDESEISADYQSGILSIKLPKREEAKEKEARNIEIS